MFQHVTFCVFTALIRPELEYACPVWYPGFNYNLSKDWTSAKTLFKTSVSLQYFETLSISGLDRLNYRIYFTL